MSSGSRTAIDNASFYGKNLAASTKLDYHSSLGAEEAISQSNLLFFRPPIYVEIWPLALLAELFCWNQVTLRQCHESRHFSSALG